MPNLTAVPSSKKVLRLPAVTRKVGACRSWIYGEIKKGNFPSPIPLGERSVGWVESEVDQWIDSRIALRG